LRRDAGMLTDCLAEDCDVSILETAAPDAELFELHQIRIGLIQFIFMKAMEIPRFSSRFDISLEELLAELLHLEVPDTLIQLRKMKKLTSLFISGFDTALLLALLKTAMPLR
ncbi:MAG: hypothetical protein JKX95_05490, partial [Bacteroidia bacterium]|nr:hypothetical protein [Bacteroidia bacterium]